MNVFSRGVRNAFRNVIRTISIITIVGLSIALSLAMLVANQAVSDKIGTIKSSVGNTVSVSPAGVRGFEGGGNALTEDQLSKLSSLAHVTNVSESLSDRLTTDNTNLQSAVEAGALGQRFANNSGQSFTPPDGAAMGGSAGGQNDTSSSSTRTFTPPVTVTGTTNPTNLSSGTTGGGGTFTLKNGTAFTGDSNDNVALLGTTLAEKNNLSVGSTFTAYGQTITVVGIFDAGNTFSNNQLLMPLKTVQTLSDQAGAVTSATITADSISNVDSVTSAVSKQLGSAADVTNAAEQAKNSVEPLENIQTISLYTLIGSIIAGAVIILLTMVMIVRERRREIGVIKAIGASNVKVVTQFMVEAVTLTGLAAVVGIVLGALAANPITDMLSKNSASNAAGGMMSRGGGGGPGFLRQNVTNLNAAVGWDIILYGLAAALIIAIVGSALASFFIAKIRPAEVMRVE
jgi:putative ABC transport system permease protein